VHLAVFHLKNFRCFSSIDLTLTKKIVIIEGPNGSGKTSLLEALHYLCYGRSFRTRITSDLITDTTDGFFVKATGQDSDGQAWQIQVGGTAAKRALKINDQSATSYKELLQLYRIISVTEDDVMMVKGAPELRRLFIDQALMLQNHDYSKLMRMFRHILAQRNSALNIASYDPSALAMWTDKLVEHTQRIQEERKSLLNLLEREVNMLIAEFIDSNHDRSAIDHSVVDHLFIHMSYQAKEYREQVLYDERRLKRTLFGAHLDDIDITFQQTSSRTHASRGQQKLIALALKIAHLRLLGRPVILLLDDFLTDFDRDKMQRVFSMVTSLSCQVIITTPLADYFVNQHLENYDYQRIILK
jgi:DNA replication and repair protein RecF